MQFPTYQFNHPQDVHIFLLDLSANYFSEQLAEYFAFLSPEEQERAKRFCADKDRHSYLLSRYYLRDVLSHYLQISRQEIKFNYHLHGKPVLAEEHHSSLQFNLSHSEDYVLLAVRHDLIIGVDIEKERQLSFMKFARRFFTEDECQQIKDSSEQQKLFFKLWTQKEAYIKAQGKSLFRNLKKSSFDHLQKENNPWFICQFIPSKKYHAAVVTERPVNEICFFKL